MLGMHLKHKAA